LKTDVPAQKNPRLLFWKESGEFFSQLTGDGASWPRGV
jgi:hypothetical protein